MIERLRKLRGQYPGQFWLLFWGMLISTIGQSLIWPFLMIYISERLHLPMTVAASMLTINSFVGLIFSFVAGPVADTFGRKWIMVISLGVSATIYLLYSIANTLPLVMLVMVLSGAFNPLYRIGADAMLADLVPPEKRINAYALLRMNNNIGVAIGPAVGGFLAAISYNIAFYVAAAATFIYCMLLLFFARETLPKVGKEDSSASEGIGQKLKKSLVGYPVILRDKPFIYSTIAFMFNMGGASLVWVMMAVYAKSHFRIPENQYGFIASTNALMVIFFQLLVTSVTKKHPPLRMMALGAVFYTIAVASVGFDRSFWGFWVSMVVMTIGELILMPTSTTYVANLAPPEMRGRYMSLYSLTWGIASGIGPVCGGFLNDTIGPAYMWFGGAFAPLISTSLYILLIRMFPKGEKEKSLKPEPAE